MGHSTDEHLLFSGISFLYWGAFNGGGGRVGHSMRGKQIQGLSGERGGDFSEELPGPFSVLIRAVSAAGCSAVPFSTLM